MFCLGAGVDWNSREGRDRMPVLKRFWTRVGTAAPSFSDVHARVDSTRDWLAGDTKLLR